MIKWYWQFGVWALLLVCFVSCMEQMHSSDLADSELRGPVKMVKESFFSAENSFEQVVPEVKFYYKTLKFDYEGRLQETSFTNYLTKIKNTTEITNDSIDKFFIKQFEAPFIRKVHYYTSIGSCIVNIYNGEKELIAYEERNSLNGRLYQINRYSGQLDILISKTNYTYTLQGRILTERTYFEKNYFEKRYQYSIGLKQESFNFSFENYRYTYDCKNRLTSKSKYWGDNPVSVIYYFYNKQGDIILEQKVDKASKLTEETTFTYTYDKYGNWITCVERRFDGNVFVKERVITYYHSVF